MAKNRRGAQNRRQAHMRPKARKGNSIVTRYDYSDIREYRREAIASAGCGVGMALLLIVMWALIVHCLFF